MEAGIPRRARSFALALLTAVAAFGLLLASAQAAGAAAPKLLAPGNGATVARGSQPIFKVRDTDRNSRRYRVFLTIAKARKFNKDGDLKQTRNSGTFTSMRRSGKHGFTYKPQDYTFPTWFMQAPGKYYWQAFHIDCAVKGCHVHSKVRSFVVG